ncbi:MAG: hypothetical protein K2Z81_23820 [Cyanobacteria bacterium]|nr:hypothetical protein [Cyanobacteriota bacterium]
MDQLENLPRRLKRALEGLVKADILTERELELLIASASNQGGRAGETDWQEILWDQVTTLRAQAEVTRSQRDSSRRTRKRSNR